MRKKSFSGFFWIFLLLVAVFLFLVMGRNVEGFGKSCKKGSDCGGARCTSSTGAKGFWYCKKAAGAKTTDYGECTC